MVGARLLSGDICGHCLVSPASQTVIRSWQQKSSLREREESQHVYRACDDMMTFNKALPP
jgi:hypothetical protein